jgi:hypothetical protein
MRGLEIALQKKVVVPRKAIIAARLPIRRGLDENEATVYLSLSPSFFRTLVEEGLMPQPVVAKDRRIWDAEEAESAGWSARIRSTLPGYTNNVQRHARARGA